MNQIEIKSITRQGDDSIALSSLFRIPVPSGFKNVKNKAEVAQSYSVNYNIETVWDNDAPTEYFIYLQTQGFGFDVTKDVIEQTLQAQYEGVKAQLESFQLRDFDVLIGSSFDGTDWSYNL